LIIAHLSRVCYPFHPYGGLEKHVSSLTLELAKQGHTVYLITQPPDPSLEKPNFWPENVKHSFVPYQTLKFLRRNSIPDRLLNYPIFSLKVGRQAKKFEPQVVHAHGLAAFGYALRPIKGVPLVLNPHGMEEFKNKSRLKQLAYYPFRAMLRFAARRSAAVIATDTALIPEVEKFLKIPRQKIWLIPNAVDIKPRMQILTAKTARNAEENKEFLLSPQPSVLSPLILLSVGRLEENKGFSYGLQALKILEKELLEGWRWFIIGEGSLRPQLEAETKKLGLAENVIFVGKVSDAELSQYYQHATIFLHPTLYEGSSLVTLEALAAGLPVVASATGGIPDKVFESGEFENGRLAPPANPQKLAQKLKEVIEMSLEKRQELGENGRRLVGVRFSWEAAGRATVELYGQLNERL